MVFVGIDLHKQYSYVVVLNARGDALDERRLVNTKVAAYIARLAEPVHVTLEATFNGQAIVEQLEDKVAEVALAHPKQVKAIASARIKTDKIDARVLADCCARTCCRPPTFPREQRAICGTWFATARI